MCDTAHEATYTITLTTIGGSEITETYTSAKKAIDRYEFIHYELKRDGYYWMEFGSPRGGIIRTRDVCSAQLTENDGGVNGS